MFFVVHEHKSICFTSGNIFFVSRTIGIFPSLMVYLIAFGHVYQVDCSLIDVNPIRYGCRLLHCRILNPLLIFPTLPVRLPFIRDN